jgi:hypothetical protein
MALDATCTSPPCPGLISMPLKNRTKCHIPTGPRLVRSTHHAGGGSGAFLAGGGSPPRIVRPWPGRVPQAPGLVMAPLGGSPPDPRERPGWMAGRRGRDLEVLEG